MDDHLDTLLTDQHHDLEHVRSTIGPHDKPPIRVIPKILHGERVLDGVQCVFISDAMAPRGGMDLHTPILYYETVWAAEGTWRPPISSLGPILLRPVYPQRTSPIGAGARRRPLAIADSGALGDVALLRPAIEALLYGGSEVPRRAPQVIDPTIRDVDLAPVRRPLSTSMQGVVVRRLRTPNGPTEFAPSDVLRCRNY